MDIQQRELDDVDKIDVAQRREKWWAPLNDVMNFRAS
jgi:hypothetical protein